MIETEVAEMIVIPPLGSEIVLDHLDLVIVNHLRDLAAIDNPLLGLEIVTLQGLIAIRTVIGTEIGMIVVIGHLLNQGIIAGLRKH